MMPTSSRTRSVARRSRRRAGVASPCRDHAHTRCGCTGHQEHRVLARYSDGRGLSREVLARPGSAGSVLVVDRDASTLGDWSTLNSSTKPSRVPTQAESPSDFPFCVFSGI